MAVLSASRRFRWCKLARRRGGHAKLGSTAAAAQLSPPADWTRRASGGDRRPRPERTSSGGGGVQNVGYKSYVLAPWGVPGKSGHIRGLVAPAEAGYK